VGLGGAIANLGTAVIARSTFSGNYAYLSYYGSGLGGAIWNGGTLGVVNSTFAGNIAGSTAPMSSTFAGYGGALYNTGRVAITNTTVYSNWATGSGGELFSAASTTLRNTIVAGKGLGGNCSGPVQDGGHNLEDANTCGLTAPTSLTDTDPLLGPLQINPPGVPLPTLALLPGSPALDAGDDAVCPATDERGVMRPFGPHCDIGAFEATFMTRRYIFPLVYRH
jgi:hypothetical protein